MLLKLELAATRDVGEHFVKATYFLQGDGPLFFSCYEVSTVSQAFQASHYPNIHAISTAIVREDPCHNLPVLEQRVKACVEPAITWFLRKFSVDLYDVVVVFKAVTILSC